MITMTSLIVVTECSFTRIIYSCREHMLSIKYGHEKTIINTLKGYKLMRRNTMMMLIPFLFPPKAKACVMHVYVLCTPPTLSR